jgi:hypothetical protein
LRKPTTTTVSNRRSGKELDLLLYCLQELVNLDEDDLSLFQRFAIEYPEFAPVTFYESKIEEVGRRNMVGWRPELYDVWRVFRDILREVWERGSNSGVAVLLGTDEEAVKIINREPGAKPGALDGILQGYETALATSVAKIPSNYLTAASRVKPNWSTGTFRYEPDTDFRRSVFELFRQSWRAKVCPHCGKYFVANKTAQRYCLAKCYGSAKRERDLEFWRNVGSNRRKERKAKERRS